MKFANNWIYDTEDCTSPNLLINQCSKPYNNPINCKSIARFKQTKHDYTNQTQTFDLEYSI
jgi:hypothetical protein